jgi:hypothetical protein
MPGLADSIHGDGAIGVKNSFPIRGSGSQGANGRQELCDIVGDGGKSNILWADNSGSLAHHLVVLNQEVGPGSSSGRRVLASHTAVAPELGGVTD